MRTFSEFIGSPRVHKILRAVSLLISLPFHGANRLKAETLRRPDKHGKTPTKTLNACGFNIEMVNNYEYSIKQYMHTVCR